jgi:ABC-type transport system involved in cytochrome c biogenesis permease subunit
MTSSRLVGILLWTGVALAVAAAGLFVGRQRRAGTAVLAAAWCAGLALFVGNWILAACPPFGNMYHVMVFLGVCIPALYALLSYRSGMGWTGVYFSVTLALALIGAGCMDRDEHWRRMPALQSPWFVPHVMAYMLSYALAAVAFVMSATGWWQGARLKTDQAERYREAAYQVVRLGFPFMTFGMLSGALWAEEAWGAYWSWDTKETWSLITWTLYLIYLHARQDRRIERWADAAQALAFLALLTTFFLVNLLPRLGGLHSYAR